MKSTLVLVILAAVLRLARAEPVTPIRFPEDGGVLDVREYGARPDDADDDTAAIQEALDSFPGTLLETRNGGVTDLTGLFLYSNQGWRDGLPALVVENSTAILCGLNERNFNRQTVSLWVRETQDGVTRELTDRPWVYLSR